MRASAPPPPRLLLLGVCLALACAACGGPAQPPRAALAAPPDPDAESYRVQHGWPLLPEGHILGQASAVGVDSHNHVFVLHRAGRVWSEPFPEERIQDPTVAIWDADSGQLLSSWGADRFVMPHGLTIDGRNHVWITDVGLQQVFEFGHDGELLRVLGEAGVEGSDAAHFGRPTDVAVRPDGSFYVSDGYRNARIALFSPRGELLLEWGTPGVGPGELDVPHDVDLDAEGLVYVTDRGNARVQIFDPRGALRGEWKAPALGRPYALDIDPAGRVFWLDAGDLPKRYEEPDRARVFRLDPTGRIETRFGRFGNQDGQFVLPHDLAVGPDGAVYVVDVYGRRAQKFVPSSPR